MSRQARKAMFELAGHVIDPFLTSRVQSMILDLSVLALL